MNSLSRELIDLAKRYSKALVRRFGDRLVAVTIFGSVARGEANERSDIDLLLVFSDLPQGRLSRRNFLGECPPEIEKDLQDLHEKGIYADFVEHLKVESEILSTPFLYEVVQDGLVLHDPRGWFARLRERILKRMRDLGSAWRTCGRFRYLDLKPDYKPGDIFEL